MPFMFVAALMFAQAPAQAAPIIVDKKKQQVCEYVEASGSRMRQRVCHDRNAPAVPGTESASDNAGMFHTPPPAPAPGGVGAPPR